MKRKLAIVFILLVILFFTIGYLPRFFQERKNERRANHIKPPAVSVMIAKSRDAPLPLVLPSTTQANHVTPVWSRADGYIATLNVDIGDQVRQGDVLALLETPEIDEQYKQALYEYQSAHVKRNIAEVNAERAELAYKADPGAISKLDRDQFIASFQEAVEDLNAAKANMNHYKDLVEFKKIVAPFDGVIIERNIDLGSLITQGSAGSPQQLFVIAQSDIIRVFVEVPQFFFRAIREGVEATTTIREFGSTPFTCKVARYAKALDATSHTMRTELHIDNKEGKVLPGLYSEVTFHLKPELPYYIVPTPAVIIRAGDPMVAVIDENNIAHLKRVKIGLDFGKTLELIDGVHPGDRIVINPTERIREGVRCEITEVQDNNKYYYPSIY